MDKIKSSKKHLFAVQHVLLELDKCTKGITSFTFNCPTKDEALKCRGNITNTLTKGILLHKYTTQLLSAVDLEGKVFWFVIVNKIKE